MNDRRELLLEQIKIAADDRIAETRIKIDDNFKRNKEEINHTIKAQAEQLFLQASDREWKYLEICYLHTGLLMKNYEYKINLYNSLHLLDNEQLGMRISFEFIYQYFEEDIRYLLQRLNRQMQKVYSNEMMEIKEYCNKYYIGMVNKYLKDTLPELTKLESFQNMKKAEPFLVLFGEYMGPQEQL